MDQNQLLLYRSLENGGTAVTGESLVDDVNTSLVYFEDRYGISVDRVLVTGVQSAQALQAAFNASSNIQVEELISSSHGGRGRGQRGALGAGGRGRGPGVLMRININLASNPYEAAREYTRRMGMLVAALLVLTVGLIGYIVHQRPHTRDVDSRSRPRGRRSASLDAEKAQAQAILNQAAESRSRRPVAIPEQPVRPQGAVVDEGLQRDGKADAGEHPRGLDEAGVQPGKSAGAARGGGDQRARQGG